MRKLPFTLSCALLVGLLLTALPCPGAAETPSAAAGLVGQAIPISVGPHADSGPILVFGAGGRAHMAWLRQEPESDAAEIVQARAPLWEAGVLQEPALSGLALTTLGGVSGDPPRLSWTSVTTQTAMVGSLALPDAQAPERFLLASARAYVAAVDPVGGLHLAQQAPGAIVYSQLAQGQTITVSLGADAALTGLALAVPRPDHAHLAWTVSPSSEPAAGLWYLSLPSLSEAVTATLPIQVAPRGRALALAADPQGNAALAWQDGDALMVVQSADWARASAVATGIETDTPSSVAIGPDGTVHLVWAQGDMLWHAASPHWGPPRSVAPIAGVAERLSLAVDPAGHPHVAWQVTSEGDAGDIYYAQLSGPSPQAAIRFPSTDDVVERDVQLRLETNLPLGMIQGVEFDVQRQSGDHDHTPPGWVYLADDRDGADGWGVALPMADLVPSQRYRVAALVQQDGGELLHASGGWFQVHPHAAPDIWLQPLGPPVVSGEGALTILLRGSERFLDAVDLFLVSPHCDASRLLCDPANRPPLGSAHYLGSYDLGREALLEPQLVTYDSRLAPDGVYRLVAVAQDPTSRVGLASLPSHEIIVDNALPPRISVGAPDAQALSEGRIAVEAQVSDRDGAVRRVDWYLEREYPLLQAPDEALTMPHRVWLGNDSQGQDGWALSLPVKDAWAGQGWRLLAEARDDGGLDSQARSLARFDLASSSVPQLLFTYPLAGSQVTGVVRVIVQPAQSNALIDSVDLYLDRGSGALEALGAMQPVGQRWSRSWDTDQVAPGKYDLLYVARLATGRSTTGRVGVLIAGTRLVPYRFAAPPEGEPVRGATSLRIEPLADAPLLQRVQFFHRDGEGQLHPIGSARSDERSWWAMWHTLGVLDGDYALVAELEDGQGNVSLVEQPVQVANRTPSIALRDWVAGPPLQGDQSVFWNASHPSGAPITVTVLYSPDAGVHWMTLAEAVPASEYYVWDTTRSPESASGLLRLVVSDGVRSSSVTTPPLAVNNTNQPPALTILAPKPNSSEPELRIAWEAWDPDGDPLTVKVDYRQGDGPWRRLASDLAPQMSYLWQEPPPPAGGALELRVSATDPSGAQADDLVAGISLTQGRPPEVSLLWPGSDVTLANEAFVLWRASDADGDRLEIDLYYSDNGGKAWLPLADGLANTGYFGWQVGFLPSGDQYRVRVIARDSKFSAVDESVGTFAVGQCPQRLVRILQPLPGQTVSGQVQVAWSELAPSLAAEALLELRPVGSNEWTRLALGPNDGFSLWDTRPLADGRYELRLNLTEGPCVASQVADQPITISNRSNSRPEITLQAPRGGEQWQGLHAVAWSARDLDGEPLTVTLSVSADGGSTWQPLLQTAATEGQHIWDTRAYAPGRYLVRARVSDAQTQVSDISEGYVALTHQHSHPPDVRLLSPSASGLLLRGDTVSWRAEDLDGDLVTVDLAVSQDGGLGWKTLAQGRSAMGEYRLGDDLAWDRQHAIRVRAFDGVYWVERVALAAGRSAPAAQRIALELLAPQRGQEVSGQYTVRWRSSASSPQRWAMALLASRDGGRTWQSVANALQGRDDYVWDTSSASNGVYRLALVADDGRFQSRTVSGPFTVHNVGQAPMQVSLVLANEPQVWTGLEEIAWRMAASAGPPSDAAARVRLEYSTDRGHSWRLLASQAWGNGTLTWDTSLAPNCDELWLRITASVAGRSIQTIHPSPIAVRNPLAPTVRLVALSDGATWQGRQVVAWRTARAAGSSPTVRLEYSLDGGKRWTQFAKGLPADGRHILDTSSLPMRGDLLLRAIASDGRQTGVDTLWEPIRLDGDLSPEEAPAYPR